MHVFLCFMSYALRYSSYFFVHLLIFFSLECLYVNQAAHVSLVLTNENNDDDDIVLALLATELLHCSSLRL